VAGIKKIPFRFF